jgi:hypothetical protein
MYTSEVERDEIEMQATELRNKVQVEKNKLFHFGNLFIASIVLVMFFTYKSFDLLIQYDVLSIVINCILIVFSFLLFICKYTALDNLTFYKQLLWLYETPTEEVVQQFEGFCDFDNQN